MTLSCAASKFLFRVAGPVGQALCQGAGLGRVGRGNLQDIHEVQCRQVIEVHDVIVQSMVDQDEVTDVLRVQWNFKIQCIFHRTDG